MVNQPPRAEVPKLQYKNSQQQQASWGHRVAGILVFGTLCMHLPTVRRTSGSHRLPVGWHEQEANSLPACVPALCLHLELGPGSSLCTAPAARSVICAGEQLKQAPDKQLSQKQTSVLQGEAERELHRVWGLYYLNKCSVR